MNIISRKNSKFVIENQAIKPEFRKVDVINGLYAAVYEEFKGAIHNTKYSQMTAFERLEELNRFAENWLKQRGFLNG